MRKTTLLLITLLASNALAQTTLSTLVGRVTAGTSGLPGVSVSVNSPGLQGQRTAITGQDGQYVIPALPPGDYLITFAMPGLQQAVQRAQLRLAETTRVDADLRPESISQEITVMPAEQTVLETPQVSTNIDATTLEYLPTSRGILDFAKLAAGVTEVGASNLIVISGAQPYDNLYMVNGVTITERRRNQPLNLYIEDAIQEATILTGGISAEYGRFAGGVVNVITKSGGNTLSGSLRDTISSNAWTDKTAFPGELDHLDEIDYEYQATLGGSVVRDRLWFFGAARLVGKDFARQTRLTNIPFRNETGENRYEAKLTANLTQRHSLVGSYLNVNDERDNQSTATDLRGLYNLRNTYSLAALRYTGIFAQTFVVEGQFSRKENTTSTIAATDGIDSSFVNGTIISDLSGVTTSMWAPFFCVTCGPEYGNGRDALLKVSRFTPTRRFGTHDVLAGVDEYHDLGRTVGYPSTSKFVVYGGIFAKGTTAYPRFSPDEAYIDYYDQPETQRSDFRTRSAFVNDQISIGSRLTTTVGFRYDANHGEDTDGRIVSNDSRISPRLGLTYDVRGNGSDRFSASFGRYTSKALENPLEPATSAVSPTIYTFYYDGPEINGDPATAVPTAVAMQRLYDWFLARGGLDDKSDAEVFANLAYDLGTEIATPAADEYTVGFGHQFGTTGAVQVNYINRHWFDFYTVHVTTDNRDALGDHIVVDNNDRGLVRDYDGVSLQGRWRRRRFSVAGNYTWSKLRGNVEQESNGSPVAEASAVDWYPELSSFEQFQPIGYLNGDIRHVANAWASWDFSTERTHLNASVLQRFHSARNYNARQAIRIQGVLPNPGYDVVPAALQYYFQPRGEQRLANVSSTGIGLNAARKFGVAEIFAQIDVQNVFNEDAIENPAGIDKTVLTILRDRNLAPFNPLTKEPIECPADVATTSAQCRGIANFKYGPNYGKPSSAVAYQIPRTYGFSIGARF